MRKLRPFDKVPERSTTAHTAHERHIHRHSVQALGNMYRPHVKFFVRSLLTHYKLSNVGRPRAAGAGPALFFLFNEVLSQQHVNKMYLVVHIYAATPGTYTKNKTCLYKEVFSFNLEH